MTDPKHINPEDLALYAMQLLSKDETDAIAGEPCATSVRTHLEQCGECRNEFMAAQDDLALVAVSVDMESPAPQARERFIRQVAREKRVVRIDRVPFTTDGTGMVQTNTPKQGGKLLPWLGWAVAAGVAFSATSLYRDHQHMQATVADQSAQLKAETAQMAAMSANAARAKAIMDALTDNSAQRVTLNTTPAAKASPPQGKATYVAKKGTLLFSANNLDQLPLAKVYELWLIPSDGSAPIPAGTFRADNHGNGNVILPQLPLGVQAKAFAVTIEPEGGSKTPTMPILMVGA